MRDVVTNDDAFTLALSALGWAVGDLMRARRLLDLTGLTPHDLRARADAPDVLAAVLMFLEGHEPDLIACADEIGATPQQLVAARQLLENL